MFFYANLGATSGLGAQLQQLAFLLNIGKVIGREFVNIVERNYCLRSEIDIFDTLGLRQAFISIPEAKKQPSQLIVVTDAFFDIREGEAIFSDDKLRIAFDKFDNDTCIDLHFKDWSQLQQFRKLRPDLMSLSILRERYDSDLFTDKLKQDLSLCVIHIRAGDVAVLPRFPQQVTH